MGLARKKVPETFFSGSFFLPYNPETAAFIPPKPELRLRDGPGPFRPPSFPATVSLP
jgi:hypothetical protein